MSGSAALDPRFEASGTLSGTASVREDSKAASLQFPDLLSFEGGKAAAASAAPAAGGASGGESGGAKGKGKAASNGKGKKPAASGAGADEDDREAERKRKREEAAARKAERGRKAEAAAKKKKDEEAAKKKKVVEVKFDEVPAGQKKKIEGTPMLDAYHPKAVEHSWDAWWQEQGYYSCDPEEAAAVGEEGRFVMVIPPPNVTGSLHLGHALTCAVEDTLARWHRMRGKKVMWLPGTDHAGIATQAVVERMLKRDEGKTRQDLGREKFLEKVWEWKEQYGGRICSQLRSLGVSVDWSRERFTMDAGLSKAVNACFVTLFERGLIYRQSRLVNWCCALNTAISDIEVDYMDVEKPLKRAVPGHDPKKKYEFGWLTNFAYKLEKPVAGLEELVVATTRLETMLGDVAVAVHPEDPRYKAIHGASLVHPFTGRKIPVITDGELVDMSFGTGAVKITPAHDPNDFACGLRHGLPEIVVLSDDGRMNEQAGIFKGQMRFDARINVAKELEKLGLLRGKEPNKMRIGVCSRSGDIIEPLPKPQWWMACKDMAAKAAKSVRDGELKIVPKMHESTWFHWLDNCQDWCISRQLWWGHRIPAYFVTVEGQPRAPDSSLDHWVVAKSDEEAKAKAAAKLGVDASKITLEQDEDVLDTWFSSGLFPFSTFGWPDEGHLDYNGFYPNTLLETGHDILFFWVARMVMMGMELTGKLPFRTVYLHAMVRDKYGRKMSKSLGNVIDPMEVIDGCSLEHLHDKLSKGNLPPSEVKKAQQGQSKEYPYGIPECGADALRFGLLAYTKQGRDINLDTNRVVAYRHFCNKLWNATKLLLSYLPEGYKVPMSIGEMEAYFASPDGRGSLAVRDRWILSRLHHAVTAANTGLDKFHFAEACEAMHGFWLHDLCDVYLELTKAVVRGEDAAAKDQTLMVLMYCYETGLRMLHPVMPFVTEELWHRMPTRGTDWSEGIPDPPSVMVAPYPMPIEGTADPHAERMVDACMRAVKAARVIRSKVNLKAKQKTELFIRCEAEAGADFSAMAEDICQLGGGTSVAIIEPGAAAPGGCLPEVVDASATLLSKVQGAVDAKAEAARMQKQMDKKVKALAKQEKKMATEKYKTKTPTEIQEKDAGAVNEQKLEIARIQESIEQMLALA